MKTEKVVQIIDEFLRQNKKDSLEEIYKDAVKSFSDSIRNSSEEETKIAAIKIVEEKKTKEQNDLDYYQLKCNKLFKLKYKNLLITVKESNKKKQISSDSFKQLIVDKVSKIDEKYDPINWINYVGTKANKVSLAVTHIAKLTHSSAKASNINVNAYSSPSTKSLLVTVTCSDKLEMDFSYSDAKFAPVAKFLQEDCDGELLGKVICSNPAVLASIAKDDNQLQQWQEQISSAFNEKEKSSHQLAKQVYFPIKARYHLLAPMISSSMAQLIYERVWQTRQKDMPARKAKKENLFNSEIDVSYQTAILVLTQSNHQNVSNLNRKRSGGMLLFSCQPPVWKTQIKPPIDLSTVFGKELGYQAKKPLQELRNLLLAMKYNKLNLNLQRKQHILALIAEIFEVVFNYVSQLYRLKQYAGWSRQSKLPIYQQYWLDPFRPDEDFQKMRGNINWQIDVINDFSKWVTNKLNHKKLTLGVDHDKQWKKLLTPMFREFYVINDLSLDEIAVDGVKI